MPFRRLRQSIFISFLKSKIWLPKLSESLKFWQSKTSSQSLWGVQKMSSFYIDKFHLLQSFRGSLSFWSSQNYFTDSGFSEHIRPCLPWQIGPFFNFKTVKRVKVFIHLKAAHHSPMVNHHQARRAWSLRCLSERGGKCININFRPKLSCVRIALEILESF